MEVKLLDRYGDGWSGARLSATYAEGVLGPQADGFGFSATPGAREETAVFVIAALARSTLTVSTWNEDPDLRERWEVRGMEVLKIDS